MTAETIVPVPAEWSARAKVNAAQYADMYRRSLDHPDGFWTEHGRRLYWIAPFATGSRWSFDERSEEHTSELPSLMRISHAVFCLKKKKKPVLIDRLKRYTSNHNT